MRPVLVSFVLFSVLAGLFAGPADADEIGVQAVPEKQHVYVGESFGLQIQVNGDDSPVKPDMSGVVDFQVVESGGQQNSSQSITIINGKVNRISRQGYIFNYSLSAKREGKLVIPAIEVTVRGRKLSTQPLTIIASKPRETKDFKLRLHFDKQECYVGEPVVLEVTWYIGRSVEDFSFTLPYLDDPHLTITTLPDDASGRETVNIPLAGTTVAAVKDHGVLDGREYLTVHFRQVVVPKEPGRITLPQSTVSSKTLTGYQRGSDPFDDFFSWRRRGNYETVITPSNEPEINVLSLPTDGRPVNFTGLVGSYSMVASATPTEVNIGDPITLTIMVTGPEYLANVKLPDLRNNNELTRSFKIPDEMAAGVVQGRNKVFTQTIRAKNDAVKEIPPVSLSFFNPESGSYETISTAPIPLQVQATRIVTARDAEGGPSMPDQSELLERRQGIAQNFEGPAVLVPGDLMRPDRLMPITWLPLLILPPGFFILFALGLFVYRQRAGNAGQRSVRRSYAAFDNRLKQIDQVGAGVYGVVYDRLGEAIREYLGTRLGLTPKTLTYRDVEGELLARSVGRQNLTALRKLMERCDAHRYGGAAAEASSGDDIREARKVLAAIDEVLS